MKKNTQAGVSPKVIPITSSTCGNTGCDLLPYVMPHGGTVIDFDRHKKEKFKTFKHVA